MTMKAISYYYDLMADNGYSGIKLHKTGKAALECIKEDSKSLFQMPVRWKNKNIAVTRRSPVTIGFYHRKLVARFLDEDELKVIEEHGDDFWWDYKNGRVVAPQLNDAKI